MSKDQMRYKELVDDALRNVVRQALARVAESGLPGNHHLYVSFRSSYPGVLAPEHLRQKYPEEITIVLQHQFWGLTVGEDSFEITLSFNGVHELLSVPFGALTGFVDPSVRFGLQFQVEGEDDESTATASLGNRGDIPNSVDLEDQPVEVPAPGSDTAEGENIVTLDQFRKK